MLPKLDTFVLLTNEGPSLEKDEHWSKNKHGDDGMRMGNKNRVTSDDFEDYKATIMSACSLGRNIQDATS